MPPSTAPLLYPLLRDVVVGPPLRRLLDVEVTGAHRIPRDGPIVVAANHCAEIDSLILPLAVPRRLSFLAKAEYFTAPGWRGLASRTFFAGTGQIPVDRGGGDGAALDAATALLRRGGAWGIYPEGTRSPDGRLHRGHTGALRVAARVPGTRIVPVALDGTAHVNPPGTRSIRRGRVLVRIGEPIDAADLLGCDVRTGRANRTGDGGDGDGRGDDARTGDVRAGTDALMATIADLGGLEYVDVYARSGSAT